MRHFCFYFLIMLLTYPFSPAKGQFDTKKYDKEKFLIGTLGDGLLGYQRFFTPLSEEVRYNWLPINKRDVRFALFIDSLFRKEYPDLKILYTRDSPHATIQSRLLLHTADRYFTYKQATQYTDVPGTVFNGSFEANSFLTTEDKLSFLLGAYLIHGMTEEHATERYQYYQNRNSVPIKSTDKLYGFYFTYAADKARLCADFLKQVGCRKVQYGEVRNTIPNAYFVFFKPNSKVRKLIAECNQLMDFIENIPSDYTQIATEVTD